MKINLRSFLISFYLWFFIMITIPPLFVLYMAIWITVLPFDHKNVITHYYTFLWTRLYLMANPGWRLKIENREEIDMNKKYILISNHQSIIDIALLLQLRINFKWVSKKELAKVPFVGWVIWMNSHILVKRGDKQSVIKMAEACKHALNEGISIFMFPEGTRAESGKIQSFKDGAFILARENNVPILPLILDGSGNALPGKGFWFSMDQVFTLRVLDEITSETVKTLTHEQLKEHTHKIMSEELIKIRKMPQL